MSRNRADPRARDSTGAGQQIRGGEPRTCRQATRAVEEIASKTYERGFLDGWRDRAEYARRAGLSFDDGVEVGFAAGVRAADRAMRNAIANTTGGMPADAAEVVRQLVAGWDVLNWRAEADRPGQRPGDYPGREAA